MIKGAELVDSQPKVLSVKLKGNKKLQQLKTSDFFYGALPPGILATGASQQSQEQPLLN